MIIDRYPNMLLYIIIEVLLCMAIITIIVLSFVGYFSLSYGDRAVNDISSNWLKSPIIDIIPSVGDCPSGYGPLIEEQWGGTVSGCDCVGRYSYRIPYNKRNMLNRETCSWNMTLAGCDSISSIPPMKYNTWKGVNLCTKKTIYKFNDYLTNSVASSKSCRNGYKQCGTMDTSGNVLCINSNDICPVNKIIMQSSTMTPPTDFNYKKISLSSASSLYFTNEAINNNVVLEFKLSEGLVCVDPGEKNSQYKQYILDTNYYNYPCLTNVNTIKFDNRFVRIDTILKRDLFQENYILDRLNNYAHRYPISSLNANVDLFIRPFIGWKLNCVGDSFYDPTIVNILAERIDSLQTSKIVIIVFSIIVLVLFIALQVFKWGFLIKSGDVILFNLSESGFTVFCFVILVTSFVCVSKLGGYSTELQNFNCGDEITNNVFEALGGNFGDNLAYDRTILILSFWSCSCYLLYLLFDFLTKRREKCFNRDNEMGGLYNSNENSVSAGLPYNSEPIITPGYESNTNQGGFNNFSNSDFVNNNQGEGYNNNSDFVNNNMGAPYTSYNQNQNNLPKTDVPAVNVQINNNEVGVIVNNDNQNSNNPFPSFNDINEKN